MMIVTGEVWHAGHTTYIGPAKAAQSHDELFHMATIATCTIHSTHTHKYLSWVV